MRGKTLRGSKQAADGSGALHLLSACACAAGLGVGQRSVDGKSNEIKTIPELPDMPAIKGAIISIDALERHRRKIAATRAQWGIENNLHRQLDITFDENRCRTR